MAKRSLNIKNLVPRKNGQYKQGYYSLINPLKYLGDPNKIIFRSSYEKKFAVYCDTNERILSWSSEPVQIPYFHPIDQVVRPYNVDFYIKLKEAEDKFSQYIIEVKPARQLIKPNAPTGRINEKKMNSYNNALKSYLINMTKFAAAKTYAENRGWKFLIVTEQFLFN